MPWGKTHRIGGWSLVDSAASRAYPVYCVHKNVTHLDMGAKSMSLKFKIFIQVK